MKVSEIQLKVLKVLEEYWDGETVPYLKTIAQLSGLDFRQARIACRALKRKGLVELQLGLMNDDGMIAGSGYMINLAGIDFLKTPPNI